ncbi:tRNA threonylcarbamoyladenosine dehydratase [Marinilabiliaceae bacterium JC017]|nr:tRNA threonylcarbamoyladenosine dehydratase [Marinilabiliaceae bacterium JC017]
MEWLTRTRLLLGEEKLQRLQQAHVLVVGLGGVGSYAAEQIARAGVGRMTIVDGDVISDSNRNRQLPALTSTLGHAKADVVAKRLWDINPDLDLTVINEFLKEERIAEILDHPYDFVVDAIDTLSPKVFLILSSLKKGHKLISSMGAGGKMNPSEIRIADISKSYNCNLARMIRKRIYKFGIRKGFKVVFSPETVDKNHIIFTEGEQNKKTTVGTISYMPAMFGLYAASYVINELTKTLDEVVRN